MKALSLSLSLSLFVATILRQSFSLVKQMAAVLTLDVIIQTISPSHPLLSNAKHRNGHIACIKGSLFLDLVYQLG